MTSIFDLFNPFTTSRVPPAERDTLSILDRNISATRDEAQAEVANGDIMMTALRRHGQRLADDHTTRATAISESWRDMTAAMQQLQGAGTLAQAFAEYLTDAGERAILTMDALRQRGDIFLEHEAAGCPPVLAYDYEVVMDGCDLTHPCNYQLLRILPPAGVEIDDTKRPYVIIDPRAGHGPGIGGFKSDSQVGVGLKAGHPVYFVSFRREPEPGQYISFITRAEAEFVREVMRRHPAAPRPVVMGNCQGGWATLLVAAMNPDLTGPIVVNGSPVAPWAGEVGTNPMRYNAGVLGGTWVPMMLSDLGGGIFDGANLVMNFELLNPGRTLFRKYTDLMRDADTGVERFLEFERWWGGYFLMNEAEIRWIVEQLFVGNRLVKNEMRIEPGRPVDIKAIRAPMIVFASRGDNITPPQQALNWIAETYADVEEIRIRGQRIIYMVHEQVGHLGIFVSGQVARKEHSEVGSTLSTIEALAPGLYEMVIEDIQEEDGTAKFFVSFAERSLDDIRAYDDGVEDERPFAAVARTSEVQAQIYDATLRPLIRASVTESMAEAARALHPNRSSRAILSSKNPAIAPIERMAERVRDNRRKADPTNPFLTWENLAADMVEQSIDMIRDTRDMIYEMTFFNVWGSPWARRFGRTHEARRTLKGKAELRSLPEVSAALLNIDRGGFAEAVIRMLILLADNRGQVRRDRLERSSAVLSTHEPFASLGAERRAHIIHEQTLIATYTGDEAVTTLRQLLPTTEERELAVAVCQYIPGRIDEMAPHTLELLQRFRDELGLKSLTADITEDPMAGATMFNQPAPKPAPAQNPRKTAARKSAPIGTAAVDAAAISSYPLTPNEAAGLPDGQPTDGQANGAAPQTAAPETATDDKTEK